MFFGNKPSKPQNRIDTLIGAETTVAGDISFSGGLRVDGRIKGNVTAADDKPCTLVLSEAARIEGVIRVSHVVINGTVVGPVYASEYAELQGKSRVSGDVFYKKLEMQMGAIVEGKLVYAGENPQEVLHLEQVIDQSA